VGFYVGTDGQEHGFYRCRVSGESRPTYKYRDRRFDHP
jgi:hypothetical protein